MRESSGPGLMDGVAKEADKQAWRRVKRIIPKQQTWSGFFGDDMFNTGYSNFQYKAVDRRASGGRHYVLHHDLQGEEEYEG